MAASKPNLAELVEKMPATDRELQAQKAAEQAQTQQKPPRRPDRAGQGSTFTGPEPGAAEKIYDEIIAGGRESLVELIQLIRDPGDPEFKNYKAEYVLHGLTIYVGRPGNESKRKLVIDTLAAQLDNEKLGKPVRGFLVRELQTVGDKTVVGALGRLLADADLCQPAATALLAIGDGAADQLRAALPGASGQCRLVIVQSLGVVRDEKSLPALRSAVSDDDRGVRLAAAWALANIGDAGAVDLLMKAANVEQSFERVKATQACLVMAENLVAAGKKNEAVKIYDYLRRTRTSPREQYIRDLAAKALSALGGKLT